ncbi:hypothetical protein GUITHDRAFT_109414 [Guillardia theta CCMP2712]|uniref:Uncharacterized protein n=1 Tax=Guillardia theta (strain CCMP2712) TaxID=905079 RepID=L1J956_GUITC|nr:hypothetical protein GUITHDRAFT_109414 [Guillardia theta CCMP2712]EKX44639.1 hypothetical protein GUITHDRAFT_109414 [Guillardia theta CCMP2712]|eukprot:XP_005831619.1 hypothetical protein GUITHDRAFT_109414 [Guillardia theta CCMP2712]
MWMLALDQQSRYDGACLPRLLKGLIVEGSEAPSILRAGQRSRSPFADSDRKQRHKLSCRNKSRLSLQDKMDIVSLFYSPMPPSSSTTQVVTQSSIAKMYGKSRSAICKVLKLQSIH